MSETQVTTRLTGLRPLIVLALAGAILAFLLAWPALSFGGFCFAQKRFLADAEFFEVAIAQINGLARHPVDVPGGYKHVRPVPYRDMAAFRASNPDCCKFVPHNSGIEVGHVSFLDRLLGYAASSVHLAYMLNYVDDDGRRRSVATAAQMVIGNCGQVLNTAARL